MYFQLEQLPPALGSGWKQAATHICTHHVCWGILGKLQATEHLPLKKSSYLKQDILKGLFLISPFTFNSWLSSSHPYHEAKPAPAEEAYDLEAKSNC